MLVKAQPLSDCKALFVKLKLEKELQCIAALSRFILRLSLLFCDTDDYM